MTKIAKRGHEYGVVHLEIENPIDLYSLLACELQLTEEQSKDLLWLGAIYKNHYRITEVKNHHLVENDYLRIHTRPRRFDISLIAYPDLILAENNDFIVVHKPSGLSVHPSVDNIQENLITVLKVKCKQDLKITSRLDVPTSGILLFAKTDTFQKTFNSYLAEGKVKKIYRAFVSKENHSVSQKTYIHFMKPSPRAPKEVSEEAMANWQRCELAIISIKEHSDCLELWIDLKTGRTHQIRAQLQAIGFSIIGDTMYGSKYIAKANHEQILLESFSLEFPGFHFCLKDSALYRKEYDVHQWYNQKA